MPKLSVGVTHDDAGGVDVAFVLGPFPAGTVLNRLRSAFDTPLAADTGANRVACLSLALANSHPGNVHADCLVAIVGGDSVVAAPIQSATNSQAVMDGQTPIPLPAMGAMDLPLGVTLESAAYLVGHLMSGLPGPIAGVSSLSGALGVDVLWPDEASVTGFSESQAGSGSPAKSKPLTSKTSKVPHPPVRTVAPKPPQSGGRPSPQPTARPGR